MNRNNAELWFIYKAHQRFNSSYKMKVKKKNLKYFFSIEQNKDPCHALAASFDFLFFNIVITAPNVVFFVFYSSEIRSLRHHTAYLN